MTKVLDSEWLANKTIWICHKKIPQSAKI